MFIDPIFDNFKDIRVITEKLQDGVFTINSFNPQLYLNWDAMGIVGVPDKHKAQYHMHIDHTSYGVCDSPEQFLKVMDGKIKNHPSKFCVFLTHIPKEQGEMGWRWHKWGPYIGEGTPTMEYLADEEEFNDGVYVYQIYCLDN